MDWQEKKYSEVFDNVCSSLEWRARNDASFSVKHLEDSLKSLYSRQGNNWDGGSEIAEVTLAATIAAFECVLAEYQDKKTSDVN